MLQLSLLLTVSVDSVQIGIMLPMFGTEADGYRRDSNGISMLQAAHMALQEVNNKSDGILDWLLPNTALLFSYRDSKCDNEVGLSSMLSLIRESFGGMGVSAILGARCSGATIPAAQVASVFKVPLVSPASSSSHLSDGLEFPFFARTCATSELMAYAMVDVLINLFNFSTVAVASSVASYGTMAMANFRVAMTGTG